MLSEAKELQSIILRPPATGLAGSSTETQSLSSRNLDKNETETLQGPRQTLVL